MPEGQPCPARGFLDRSCSERRISASAYSLLSATRSRIPRHDAEIVPRDVGEQQVVDAALQRVDRTHRVLALGRQPDLDAAPVAQAGLLGQQSHAGQPADLGGDVGRSELGVIGKLADRDAFAALLIGGADQHDELRRGQPERAPERLPAGVETVEHQRHQVEGFAKRHVAAGTQQRRQRHRRRRHERILSSRLCHGDFYHIARLTASKKATSCS